MRGNKSNHKKVYVRWDDWQEWLQEEWYPFKANELAHLKADMSWVKRLLIGLILAILVGAIAVIISVL